MLIELLKLSDEPRITHHVLHKGMSVYQIKLSALKEITGITPPKEITYKVDSSIINFYIEKIKQ